MVLQLPATGVKAFLKIKIKIKQAYFAFYILLTSERRIKLFPLSNQHLQAERNTFVSVLKIRVYFALFIDTQTLMLVHTVYTKN